MTVTAFLRDKDTYLTPNPTRGSWTRATGFITNEWFTTAWASRVKAVLAEYGQGSPNMPVFWPKQGRRVGDHASIYSYGGTIYYTVNGADPATLTEAQLADTTIVKKVTPNGWKVETREGILPGQSKTIQVRSRVANRIWSTLNTATFTGP
jgi:hypothetical protein